MSDKIKGHLISHTHWDREWYQPVEIYRFRLMEVFGRLKEIFSSGKPFHSFFLDGQTIPVDDYLEARKGDAAWVGALIASGKLRIGPFYVLLDEQLVSGESFVRNLLIGMADMRKFGGSSAIGYLPDNFGHVSQTPQILRGFGIDNAVMWRGYPMDASTSPEAWWEGADGSRVKAALLVRGYSNCAGADPGGDPSSLTRAFESLAELKRRSRHGAILLMHGIDHAMPHPGACELAEALNAQDPEVETVHSDFESYLQDVPWADVTQLLHGELLDAPHLDGTFSSRMALKQMNRKCENELSGYAEPLATIAWMDGAEYPSEDFERTWRLLIQCHAHDSITGCHADRVAQDMRNRLDTAHEMAGYLARQGLDGVCGERFDYQDPTNSHFIAVFNPSPHCREEVVRTQVFLPETAGVVRKILVKNQDEWIEARLVGMEELCWPLRSDYMIPKRTPHKRFTIEFGPVKLKPLAVTSFEFRVIDESKVNDNLMDAFVGGAAELTSKRVGVQRRGEVLENELVAVKVNPDASVDVTDKASGRIWRGLHAIEAESDAGNLYNFSPLLRRSRYCLVPKSIEVEEEFSTSATIVVNGSLHVPAGLDSEGAPLAAKVVCPVTVRITLRQGDPVVHFRTSLVNYAGNLCVRAVFASGLENAVNHAHTSFDVVERQPLSEDFLAVGNRRVATGICRYCAQYFTSISEGDAGLALLNRGLPEYTFHKGGIMTLTLLRSTNCVWGTGKKDYPLREYPAEAGLEPGAHEREYGLLLHHGDIFADDTLRRAMAYNLPPLARVYARQTVNPFEMRLEPAALLLTALKRGEDGKGVIARFHNVLSTSCKATLSFNREFTQVSRCRLDETEERQVSSGGRQLELDVASKEIVTLKILFHPTARGAGGRIAPEPAGVS